MCILCTEIHNYTNLNTKLISYSSYNDVTGSDYGVKGWNVEVISLICGFREDLAKKKNKEIYSCII